MNTDILTAFSRSLLALGGVSFGIQIRLRLRWAGNCGSIPGKSRCLSPFQLQTIRWVADSLIQFQMRLKLPDRKANRLPVPNSGGTSTTNNREQSRFVIITVLKRPLRS